MGRIMPMLGQCPYTLFKQWKFWWSSNGLRYSCIQIASDYADMVKANMGPMLEKIGRLCKVYSEQWGKINCIKMMTAHVIYYIISSI